MELIIFLFLIGLGYFSGTWIEKKHYKSIMEREKKYLKTMVFSSKKFNLSNYNIVSSTLVYGNVVISIDYFKRILAGLKNFFGGKVTPYESLLDRARREAILRMKEMNPQASLIINSRIETASISKNTRKGSVGSIEALAYGTAIVISKK